MTSDFRISPAHTPYDGSSKPFAIGLKPLDLSEWIETGRDLGRLLAEKERLIASCRDAVLVEEADTRPAQEEVLALLLDHLPRRFPAVWQRRADAVHVLPDVGSGARIHVALGTADPPLLTAARMVGEDIVLMRRDSSGWRLVAAVLCFPSSWSLREKFGRPLQQIHAPVPSFGEGTRAATLIERIFDNLAVEGPVQRWNWSLQHDAELYLPFSRRSPPPGTPAWPGFEDAEAAARAFIRVERQTLRRLPVSRDIVFTIRIHLDPLATLAAHPERARIAAGFADQLAALDSGQLAYKGMTDDRERLLTAVRAIAAG